MLIGKVVFREEKHKEPQISFRFGWARLSGQRLYWRLWGSEIIEPRAAIGHSLVKCSRARGLFDLLGLTNFAQHDEGPVAHGDYGHL